MTNPETCTNCNKGNVSPWSSGMTARKCGVCKMIQERSGEFHVDCPCWATGVFVVGKGCELHPWVP